MNINIRCLICKSIKIFKLKKKNTISAYYTQDFKISDLSFGKTLPLYKCKECHFIFAERNEKKIFDKIYTNLEDQEYIDSEKQREHQFKDILKKYLKNYSLPKNHLDVGAGNGLLVKIMSEKGIKSLGIEPSLFLSRDGIIKNRNVITGNLKDLLNQNKKFDFITLIDVIEHVDDPEDVLLDCERLLSNDGKLLIVTPNADSFVAKLLGFKWWHYRVAHISYFNSQNLELLLNNCGLKFNSSFNTSWTFSWYYFYKRVTVYFKFLKVFDKFFTKKIDKFISINFFDSLGIVCEKSSKKK